MNLRTQVASVLPLVMFLMAALVLVAAGLGSVLTGDLATGYVLIAAGTVALVVFAVQLARYSWGR
jgi:hypothetical protein